jgi:hypothetical protein
MKVTYDTTQLYKQITQLSRELGYISRLHIKGIMCELADVDNTADLKLQMGDGSAAEGEIIHKKVVKNVSVVHGFGNIQLN